MPVAYQSGESRPKPKAKTTPKKRTPPKRTTVAAGGGSTGLPRGTVAAPSRLRPARRQPDGTVAPRRRTTQQLLREYRRDHPGPIGMRTADTPWQSERRPRRPVVTVGGPSGAAVLPVATRQPSPAAGPAGQALIAGGYQGPSLRQLRQAAREPWDSTNQRVRKDPDGPAQSRRPRRVATLVQPTRPGAPGLRIPVVTSKPVTRSDRPVISAVLRLAQEYLGVKYSWGSALGRSLTGAITPEAAAAIGFDCSGLISYVYGRLGVTVTPYTGTMRHEGVHVSGSLKPGDAVFFRSDYGHVGLYLGNGKFLEAPFTGSVVRITDMSERSDFMEARRFVNDAGRIFQ